MNPAFIVDGFTEQTIIQQLCPNQPIKRSINGKYVSLKRMAAEIVTLIRVLNNRYYPIVILTDREERPEDFLTVAAELKREVVEQLAIKNMTADIRIGVADRMIENWLLADADALGNPSEIPAETDGFGGKGLMKKIMPTYSETVDDPTLFFKADASKMYENSPSFKHFVNQLEDLNCPYLDFEKNTPLSKNSILMAKNTTIHTLDLKFLGQDDTIAAFLIVANREVALVESGPHSTFECLKSEVNRLGYDLKDIKKVFLTHIHFDHAGAAWALAELGATIYVHPFGEKHIVDPSKLYNSAKMIYGDKMDYLWGKMESIDPARIHATAQGERIPFGNGEMIAWHTPGHAVHHIVWQFGDDLFAGDVAGCKINGGIVVPPCPPPDIDIEAWIESLNLIKNLRVKRLHLTHFGVITTVSKHLNQLEKRLIRWSNWMRPHYEKGESNADVTPQYQAFVNKELTRFGIVGTQLAQYESANPAWMSVAGLMRYWHKKLGTK